MAENYARKKVEKEITFRIDAGGDGAQIAHEVIAEAEALRSQSGHLPFSTYTRDLLLHKFAGGPKPEPLSQEARGVAPSPKRKGRAPQGQNNQRGSRPLAKDVPYLPSMAAHTLSVPKGSGRVPPSAQHIIQLAPKGKTGVKRQPGNTTRPQSSVLDAKAEETSAPPRKKLRGQTWMAPSTPIKYYPSTAAHSWLYAPKASAFRSESHDSIQPSDEAEATAAEMPGLLSPLTPGTEAQRLANQALDREDSLMETLEPGIASYETLLSERQQELQLGPAPAIDSNDEGPYPGWKGFMLKYYQGELKAIPRPTDGIYVGETRLRRKRRCEPTGYRPRFYKLIVFKSRRLRRLAGPEAETGSLNHDPIPSIQSQISGLIPGPGIIQRTQSPTDAASPPLTMTAQPRQEPINISNQDNIAENPLPPVFHRVEPNETQQHPGLRDYINDPMTLGDGSTLQDSKSISKARATAASYASRSHSAGPTPLASEPRIQQNTLRATSVPAISVVEDASRAISRSFTLKLAMNPLSPGIGPSVGNSMTTLLENNASVPTSTPSHQAPIAVDNMPRDHTNAEKQLPGVKDRRTTHLPQVHRNGKSVDATISEDQTPPSMKRRSVARNNYGKLNRMGGSAALLRRNVVMQLLEKCDGIFPGAAEMFKPFHIEWTRIGQEGQPDQKTIQNAITALCVEGKLRQIDFTFQNLQGKLVRKSMLTLPNIEPTDPRARETRKRIIAWWPRQYIPDPVIPSDGFPGEYEPRFGRYGDLQGDKIVTGKELAARERLAALNELEQTRLSRQTLPNGQGEDPSESSEILRIPNISHVPVSHQRRGNPRHSRHSIAPRTIAASIRRRLAAITEGQTPFSLPPMSNTTNRKAGDLLWLPKEYAFSELDFENARPMLVEFSRGDEKRQQYVSYSALLNTFEEQDGNNQRLKKKVDQLIRDVAQVVLESEKQEADQQTDSLYLPIDPSSGVRKKRADGRVSKRRRTYESATSSDDDDDDDFEDEDDGDGDGYGDNEGISPNLGPDGHPNDYNRTGRRSKMRLLFSTMDPVHIFYQTTGTFSATFTGIRPPRNIAQLRGTCIRPYCYGPSSLRSPNDFPKPRFHVHEHPRQFSNRTGTIFEQRVIEALRWELEMEGLENVQFAEFPFVNHTLPHALVAAKATETQMDRSRLLVPNRKKGLFSKIFQTIKPSAGRIGKFRSAAEALAAGKGRAPQKRRRLASLAENIPHKRSRKKKFLDDDGKLKKIPRIRGPLAARSLGQNNEKRLICAVVAVRTLTGGINKVINWSLVSKAYGDSHTQFSIHRKWNNVRWKFGLALKDLESNFESAYLDAYQEGAVPALDFDNLIDYNWSWLTDWTMKLSSSQKAFTLQPDLPYDHYQLDGLYDRKDMKPMDINPYFEIDYSPVNLAKRTRIVNQAAYTSPLDQSTSMTEIDHDEELEIAKTWIRANIATPEERYDPLAARSKLGSFPEATIEAALRSLLSDKVIHQENKGRLMPGRNYDISQDCLRRMEKNITSDQLGHAQAYKMQLDKDFAEQQYSNWFPLSSDGTALALMNLAAQHQIRLTSNNLPANKWGHLDGNYQTRQMDKSRLNFNIQVRPTAHYTSGNPLEPLPEPPSQHLSSPRAKIPFWYDIHDSLVPSLWNLALAAILTMVAMRPGIDAKEIEQAVRPVLQVWEIQMIIEWCLEARVAEKTAKGFKTSEWWWLAISGNMDGDKRINVLEAPVASEPRSKGKGKETEVIDPALLRESEEDVMDLISDDGMI